MQSWYFRKPSSCFCKFVFRYIIYLVYAHNGVLYQKYSHACSHTLRSMCRPLIFDYFLHQISEITTYYVTSCNEIVLDETHQTWFNISNSCIFTTEHQVNFIHKAVTEHHITKSTPNAHYKSRHCYSRISNLCTICQPARYTLSSAPGGVGWEKYVNPVTVTRY